MLFNHLKRLPLYEIKPTVNIVYDKPGMKLQHWQSTRLLTEVSLVQVQQGNIRKSANLVFADFCHY